LFDPQYMLDLAGNLPPDLLTSIPTGWLPSSGFGGALELTRGRWGLPTPPQFLAGKKTDRGVTNVRNAKSPHWRRWLGPEFRCLVPFTMFAEPDPLGGNAWFRPVDDRPCFFAGIFVPAWRSVRKVKDGETVDDLFAFLTTEPNADVAPIHPKAMPVILHQRSEWEQWLSAPWAEGSALQRPLPDGVLTIDARQVAR
jgi:putative SOS response-associated peptidase YedK